MPLGEHVDRVLEAGAAAHPTIRAPKSELHRLISRRLEDEEGRSAIDPQELYLATACALGDRAAIATFEERFFAPVPGALSRLAFDESEIIEVIQMLRVRLFAGTRRAKSITLHSGRGAMRAAAATAIDPTPSAVTDPTAPDDVPRVVAYAGLGNLGGLVRAAAIREAIRVLRERGRVVPTTDGADGLEQVPVAADKPGLVKLAEQHRASFRAAFKQAVAQLETQERNLLSLAVVRGLGVDRIGAIYGVHRATAARWVTTARMNLTRAVHEILAAGMGATGDAAEDLLPIVEAQLELSLERMAALTEP